jgi:hypothetical protein
MMLHYLLFSLVLIGLTRILQEYKPRPKKEGRSWVRQKIKNGMTYVKRWFK